MNKHRCNYKCRKTWEFSELLQKDDIPTIATGVCPECGGMCYQVQVEDSKVDAHEKEIEQLKKEVSALRKKLECFILRYSTIGIN